MNKKGRLVLSYILNFPGCDVTYQEGWKWEQLGPEEQRWGEEAGEQQDGWQAGPGLAPSHLQSVRPDNHPVPEMSKHLTIIKRLAEENKSFIFWNREKYHNQSIIYFSFAFTSIAALIFCCRALLALYG